VILWFGDINSIVSVVKRLLLRPLGDDMWTPKCRFKVSPPR
jgi:hypothetical protein